MKYIFIVMLCVLPGKVKPFIFSLLTLVSGPESLPVCGFIF